MSSTAVFTQAKVFPHAYVVALRLRCFNLRALYWTCVITGGVAVDGSQWEARAERGSGRDRCLGDKT